MAYTSPTPITKHDHVLTHVRYLRNAEQAATFSPAEACRRVRTSPPTLRRWSDEYSAYLSRGAGILREGQRQRRYTLDDITVLGVIRRLKHEHYSDLEIKQRLLSTVRRTS